LEDKISLGTKVELILNLQNAKALGVEIPPDVSMNAEGGSQWICLVALVLSFLEHSG
jgi:hypothetical protein